jgi:ABC-type transport system involved in cytochrome c biogenesis permease subunit
VVIQLHQLTASIYLIAALVASLGLALPAPRLGRFSLLLLGAGVIAHAGCFGAMHVGGATPPLNELPVAVSFMALIGTIFYLVLARKARLLSLVVLVAPMAFVSVFVAGLRLPDPSVVEAVEGAGGSWEHAHVLLASSGLALLGIAGVAGMFYLLEHKRLKSKRRIGPRFRFPSLEALDRVNSIALGIGFPLLTLGVITGMFWVEKTNGRVWTGTPHEVWSVIAWLVYAVVVALRFTRDQGARHAAASAVGGFVFLLLAVVGVEIFA